MTTIIIIVVVALVFFVTVCVVTFMVWKRETEIRTDSIRAIESNLEKLGDKLAGDAGSLGSVPENSGFERDALREYDGNSRSYQNARRRARSIDPFAWTRADEEDSPIKTDTGDTADGGGSFIHSEDEKKEEAVAASAEVYMPDIEEAEEDTVPNDPGAAAESVETEMQDEAERYDSGQDDADYISQIDDFEIEMPEIPIESEEDETESSHGEDQLQGALDEMITPELHNYSSYHEQEGRRSHAHDVGRSGKKYTSEELDMLIKE